MADAIPTGESARTSNLSPLLKPSDVAVRLVAARIVQGKEPDSFQTDTYPDLEDIMEALHPLKRGTDWVLFGDRGALSDEQLAMFNAALPKARAIVERGDAA